MKTIRTPSTKCYYGYGVLVALFTIAVLIPFQLTARNSEEPAVTSSEADGEKTESIDENDTSVALVDKSRFTPRASGDGIETGPSAGMELSPEDKVRILEAQLRVARAKMELAESNRPKDISRDHPSYERRAAEARLQKAEARLEYITVSSKLRAAKEQLRRKKSGKASDEQNRSQAGEVSRADSSYHSAATALSGGQRDKVKELLKQEIELAEQVKELAEEKVERGSMTAYEAKQSQIEVLGLKQQLALVEDDIGKAKELLQQRIGLLEEQKRTKELQHKSGRGSLAEVIEIQRAILSLKRELAMMGLAEQ